MAIFGSKFKSKVKSAVSKVKSAVSNLASGKSKFSAFKAPKPGVTTRGQALASKVKSAVKSYAGGVVKRATAPVSVPGAGKTNIASRISTAVKQGSEKRAISNQVKSAQNQGNRIKGLYGGSGGGAKTDTSRLVPGGMFGESAPVGTPGSFDYAKPQLPPTKAPVVADEVVQTKSPTLPDSVAPEIGDTTNAEATNAGLGTYNDLQIEQDKSELDRINEKKKGLLAAFQDQTKDYQSPAEIRAKLESQYGIKSKLSELDSLNSSYGTVKAAMETEVGKTTDQFASTGFISRQTAAIQRRYAPELNRISSEINFKTGILNQSRELIDQAVRDATAEQKFEFDQAKMFYDLNSDIFDDMKDDYKDAYKEFMRIKEKNYDRAYSEKKLIADLAMDNPRAGISLNDTYESAISKVESSGGSLAARREVRLSTKDGGISNDKIEQSVREDIDEFIYNQQLSPEDAYKRLRNLYSSTEISDEALRNLLGITPTPQDTTSNITTPKKKSISAPYLSYWGSTNMISKFLFGK